MSQNTHSTKVLDENEVDKKCDRQVGHYTMYIFLSEKFLYACKRYAGDNIWIFN
jgi:hypothetical protein